MDTSTPAFPDFVALGPHHQTLINEIIKSDHLYSDYNFVSLWSWDHQEKLKITTLNGNLVIRFQDYVNPHEFFYSFFGTNLVDDTAKQLLDYSVAQGVPILKLIPQFVIEKIENKQAFVIAEDRDSFDYIMAVTDMVELKNAEHSSKRRSLNHFNKEYGDKAIIKEIDIKNPAVSNSILSLADKWSKQTDSEDEYKNNEGLALHKILTEHHKIKTDDLHVIGIYLDDELRAFSISEVLRDGFAMGHYKKTDRTYKGIGVALDHHTAKTLQVKGVSHLNHEQDLGIEGLRKSKLANHPVYFMKKYTISLA